MSDKLHLAIEISIFLGALWLIVLLGKHGGKILNYLREHNIWKNGPGSGNFDSSQKLVTATKKAYESDEMASKEEFERVQELIQDRKRDARNSDICQHIWDFYTMHFKNAGHELPEASAQNSDWFEFNIRSSSSRDGIEEYIFSLNGVRYRMTDNEEQCGWRMSTKLFSLSLYDSADLRLIEIPVKLRVDGSGTHYAITHDGPAAFVPGDWVNDFIRIKLKLQSLYKKALQDQSHQERLWEIENLKERFGIKEQ